MHSALKLMFPSSICLPLCPTNSIPPPSPTGSVSAVVPFDNSISFVSCFLSFFSLSLSSNLCQWSRLKGSVHVWTNPCVSDGLQPQSLLAVTYSERNPPPHSLPLLQWTLHVCVRVYVSTCLCLLLLEEGKLLHCSFILFLSDSPIVCIISVCSVSTLSRSVLHTLALLLCVVMEAGCGLEWLQRV